MNAINKDQLQTDATKLIVEQLKEFESTGLTPRWLQPWSNEGKLSWPSNLDGTTYSGINVLVLLALQEKFGFPNSTWGTYNAYNAKNAQVQKGERSAKIFFYKSLMITEKDDQGQVKLGEDGQAEEVKIPLLKSFSVFNVTQTDLKQEPVEPPSKDFQCLANALQVVDVRHGSDKAYYDRKGDFIRMPNPNQFIDEACYWAALAHEVIHWTGAAERLNRKKGLIFGNEDYAKEELVAELGAVMLLAQFGIKPDFQSAVYIASWIRSLEEDHKLIFKIAAQAQAAVNFLVKEEEL